jgi:hypothetical protein
VRYGTRHKRLNLPRKNKLCGYDNGQCQETPQAGDWPDKTIFDNPLGKLVVSHAEILLP